MRLAELNALDENSGGGRIAALLRVVAVGAADGAGAAVRRHRRADRCGGLASGGRWIGPTGSKPLPRTRGLVRARPGDRRPRRANRPDGTAAWSDAEQAGVSGAAERTRRRLVEANEDYQARFGYIFIVCATGKTATRCSTCSRRVCATIPSEELRVAGEEQRKITRLRLAKLIEEEPDTP